jgi:hypothetical protein
MGTENCVEDMDKKGNRSLRKMIQNPIRDTVRAEVLPCSRPLMLP